MTASIAEVKSVLLSAQDDNMERMIVAAHETCSMRIAKFSAALEGSNDDAAQTLLSLHLAIQQSLEQALGVTASSKDTIESYAGRL
jgi:hypothetical protein